MTRLIENKIADLVKQSDEIAKNVRLEDWEKVDQLTQRRQRALEVFFSQPVNANDAKPVEKMIRHILESDAELVDYIEQEKQKTFSRHANIKNNNKANDAYQNVALLHSS